MPFNRPTPPPHMGSNTHRYGWITEKEASLLDDLCVTLKNQFGAIRFLEIGVFGGATAFGLYERAEQINCPIHCEGVDIPQGRPPFESIKDYVFHEGDSMDMWRTFGGEFNLLFIDGCHCVNHSMMDFLNYSPMVVVGGYCLFHDTAGSGLDNVQGAFPQDHSYAGRTPSVLGVRSGLKKMGILQGHRTDWNLVQEIKESDVMGMCLFQKKNPL